MIFCRASELLLSLPAAKRRPPSHDSPKADASMFLHSMHSSTPARSRSPRPSLSFAGLSPHPSGRSTPPPLHQIRQHGAYAEHMHDGIRAEDAMLEAEEEDLVDAAKCLLDVKEYSRAHKLLHNCQSSKARFICIYSQYLVSEFALPLDLDC